MEAKANVSTPHRITVKLHASFGIPLFVAVIKPLISFLHLSLPCLRGCRLRNERYISTRPLCKSRANETCTCPRKPLTPTNRSRYREKYLESVHTGGELDEPREIGRPSSPSYPARNRGTSQEGLKRLRGPSRKMQVRRGNAALPRQAAGPPPRLEIEI